MKKLSDKPAIDMIQAELDAQIFLAAKCDTGSGYDVMKTLLALISHILTIKDLVNGLEISVTHLEELCKAQTVPLDEDDLF